MNSVNKEETEEIERIKQKVAEETKVYGSSSLSCIAWVWMVAAAAAASVARAAGPVSLPSADRLNHDIRAYVESLRVKDAGTPYGVYRPEAGARPDLYASCNAAMVRHIIGDLALTADQRRQWIDHINSFQDPTTGKYPAARFLHLFGTVVRALNILGGQPRYPVVFQREWDDVGHTKEWMAGLDWKGPWESSIKILHVAAPRAADLATTRPALDSGRVWLRHVLDWLDSRQDPRTGLWGTDRGAGNLDGVGATFHFLPLYEAMDRPFLHPREMVRSITDIQKSKHGTWGGVYVDMDAVSLLVYIHAREPALRGEIEQSVRLSVDLLFETAYKPKTGAFGTLGDTLGACEHLAEAARVLKNHSYSALAWRRAWNWRLWRCSW